jgi:hypothetical protein
MVGGFRYREGDNPGSSPVHKLRENRGAPRNARTLDYIRSGYILTHRGNSQAIAHALPAEVIRTDAHEGSGNQGSGFSACNKVQTVRPQCCFMLGSNRG